MVYNFFFDVVLFDTHFSSMQYWGICITMFTFVADIYLTAQRTKVEQSSNEHENQNDMRQAEVNSLRDRESEMDNLSLA